MYPMLKTHSITDPKRTKEVPGHGSKGGKDTDDTDQLGC